MTVEAPDRQPITARQREVYDWVVEFCETRGYSPTIREGCKAFGFKSVNGFVCHLTPLMKRGWLQYSPRHARTLRPTGGVR